MKLLTLLLVYSICLPVSAEKTKSKFLNGTAYGVVRNRIFTWDYPGRKKAQESLPKVKGMQIRLTPPGTVFDPRNGIEPEKSLFYSDGKITIVKDTEKTQLTKEETTLVLSGNVVKTEIGHIAIFIGDDYYETIYVHFYRKIDGVGMRLARLVTYSTNTR